MKNYIILSIWFGIPLPFMFLMHFQSLAIENIDNTTAIIGMIFPIIGVIAFITHIFIAIKYRKNANQLIGYILLLFPKRMCEDTEFSKLPFRIFALSVCYQFFLGFIGWMAIVSIMFSNF